MDIQLILIRLLIIISVSFNNIVNYIVALAGLNYNVLSSNSNSAELPVLRIYFSMGKVK